MCFFFLIWLIFIHLILGRRGSLIDSQQDFITTKKSWENQSVFYPKNCRTAETLLENRTVIGISIMNNGKLVSFTTWLSHRVISSERIYWQAHVKAEAEVWRWAIIVYACIPPIWVTSPLPQLSCNSCMILYPVLFLFFCRVNICHKP